MCHTKEDNIMLFLCRDVLREVEMTQQYLNLHVTCTPL